MLVSKGAACSAINCSNNRGKNPELSFFTFPKDEERCKQWIQNMRRADFTVKDAKYCRLCSHHFEDSQFVNTNKKRLIWNAVPTLFDIPNAPEKDKDKQDQHEMCGMAYPLRTKRRKIIATESNRAEVDKKAEVKLLPEVKIKQEPVAEDEQNDASKIPLEEEPFVPPIKIKEELNTEETNNNGEESEVFEPAFVGVQVNLLCKEEILEDEMVLDELPEATDTSSSSDASNGNSFTGAEEVQDPLESAQGVHEQTTSATNSPFSALDDMPLLKRRPMVPLKLKSPPASSRREVITSKKRPTVAATKKTIPPSSATPADSKASASKEKDSDESQVQERLSWLRQQKDKVEEHIRAVRQEKQLKERLEESHSALCLCIKCKNGTKRSLFQKPPVQPDSYYITTTKLCSQCNKVFKNEESYLKHMANCGTPKKGTAGVKADMPYVCSSCGQVFDNSAKQFKHMAACSAKVATTSASPSVNESADSKNSCSLCGEKFPDEASHLKHLNNCFMNKPYECYSCGRNFHDPEMRAIHVRRIHENERVCFQCGMKYETEKELESHVKLQCCRQIVTFPCLYCNRRFYNEKSRNDHTGSHLKKKFFSCSFCAEKFYYQSELIRHIDVHKAKKKENSMLNSSTHRKSISADAYECSLCGEHFDTETLKVKHILNCFRKKQYLCLVCGKHFEDRKSRAVHVVQDHKDASEDVCLQCGLKCVNLDILKQHQQFQCSLEGDHKGLTSPIKEEEEQKYVCPVCREEFQTETDLDDHTATHVEEAMYIIPDEDVPQLPTTVHEGVKVSSAVYQCTPCGILFISHRELLLHTQNKHNKYLCFYPACGITFNTVESRLQHFNANHDVQPLKRKSGFEESQSEIKIAKVEGNVQYPADLVTDRTSKNIATRVTKRGRPIRKGVTDAKKAVVNPDAETTSPNEAQGTSSSTRSEKPIILRRKRAIRKDEKPTTKPSSEKIVVYDTTRYTPYPCDVCGMKFFYLTERAQHTLTHVGEKKFSCSTCGKKFTLRANLERHMTTHMTSDSDNEEGPPFLCQICGKCFLTLASRTEHMREHPCMNCSFCGKHFSTKRSLMDHLVGVHSSQISQNNKVQG